MLMLIWVGIHSLMQYYHILVSELSVSTNADTIDIPDHYMYNRCIQAHFKKERLFMKHTTLIIH